MYIMGIVYICSGLCTVCIYFTLFLMFVIYERKIFELDLNHSMVDNNEHNQGIKELEIRVCHKLSMVTLKCSQTVISLFLSVRDCTGVDR